MLLDSSLYRNFSLFIVYAFIFYPFKASTNVFPSCTDVTSSASCPQKFENIDIEDLEELSEVFIFLSEIKKRTLAHAQLNKSQTSFHKNCFLDEKFHEKCSLFIKETKNRINELMDPLRMNMSLMGIERRVESVLPGSPIKHKAKINIKHLNMQLDTPAPLEKDEIELVSKIRQNEENVWVSDFGDSVEAKSLDQKKILAVKRLIKLKLNQKESKKRAERLFKFWNQEYIRAQSRYLSGRRKAREIEDMTTYKENYLEILGDYPLLTYLKSRKPENAEIADAFLKLEQNSDKVIQSLTEISSADLSDNIDLFFHSRIVDDILKDKPEYCHLANKLRSKYESKRLYKDLAKNMTVGGAGLVCLGVVRSPAACGTVSGLGYLFLAGHHMLNYNDQYEKVYSHHNRNAQSTGSTVLDLSDVEYDHIAAKLDVLFLGTPTLFRPAIQIAKVGKVGFVNTSKEVIKNFSLKTIPKAFVVKGEKASLHLLQKAPESYKWYDINYVSQAIPRMLTSRSATGAKELTPVRAIGGVLDRALLKRPYTFSKFVKTPVSIGTSVAIWTGAYTALESKEKEDNTKAIKGLIENDYFFSDIKMRLNDNALTDKKAEVEARKRLNAYAQYYEWMTNNLSNGISYDNPMLFNLIVRDPVLSKKFAPILDDLTVYMDPDFWSSKSIVLGGDKKLTAQGMFELFKTTHQKYAIYNSISEKDVFDPEFNDGNDKVLSSFLNNKAVKNLKRKVLSGSIDAAEGRSKLKEVLYWYSRKNEWDTLKVTPLKDGKPYDLQDKMNSIVNQ